MGKNNAPDQGGEQPTLPTHGAEVLPTVEVDSYSVELEDEEGFAGDKANKGAFLKILDDIREPLRELGEDPVGSKPSAEIGRKKPGTLLAKGDPEALFWPVSTGQMPRNIALAARLKNGPSAHGSG